MGAGDSKPSQPRATSPPYFTTTEHTLHFGVSEDSWNHSSSPLPRAAFADPPKTQYTVSYSVPREHLEDSARTPTYAVPYTRIGLASRVYSWEYMIGTCTVPDPIMTSYPMHHSSLFNRQVTPRACTSYTSISLTPSGTPSDGRGRFRMITTCEYYAHVFPAELGGNHRDNPLKNAQVIVEGTYSPRVDDTPTDDDATTSTATTAAAAAEAKKKVADDEASAAYKSALAAAQAKGDATAQSTLMRAEAKRQRALEKERPSLASQLPLPIVTPIIPWSSSSSSSSSSDAPSTISGSNTGIALRLVPVDVICDFTMADPQVHSSETHRRFEITDYSLSYLLPIISPILSDGRPELEHVIKDLSLIICSYCDIRFQVRSSLEKGKWLVVPNLDGVTHTAMSLLEMDLRIVAPSSTPASTSTSTATATTTAPTPAAQPAATAAATPASGTVLSAGELPSSSITSRVGGCYIRRRPFSIVYASQLEQASRPATFSSTQDIELRFDDHRQYGCHENMDMFLTPVRTPLVQPVTIISR